MSSPQKKLFGTDGIRARAGTFPLTPEATTVLACSAADAFLAGKSDPALPPKVVIGKDTRESGAMLEDALVTGFVSRGLDVILAGVIPTPAVAYLTRRHEALFGTVISASHNPFEDNGIKFFGPDGYKLDDAFESAIEERFTELDAASPSPAEISSKSGSATLLEAATDQYVQYVTAACTAGSQSLKGLRIALDAANGAAFRTSRAVLESLGAQVEAYHVSPNGNNINRDCGCTHPKVIESIVRDTGADVGISHDGDADRVVLCDETGSALDGDELMAIGAIDLLKKNRLQKNTLVATVMSNVGLDLVIAENGGKVVRADVGDRYVIEEMRRGGFNFGGEQSGHLIYRDLNTTGDGIIAAVQIITAMQKSGQKLSSLRRILEKLPQAQRHLPVKSKPPLEELTPVADEIRRTEKLLATAGRVLVRYSGTESLLRILVEGHDRTAIESYADAIAEAAVREIGLH